MNTPSHHLNDDATTSVRIGEPFTNPVAQGSPVARWLALSAVAGPILFTLAWIVLGFLSPGYTLWGLRIAPYSPVSQPISGLGLGPTAPYMNAAFVLSGLLAIVGVIGIFQTIRTSDRVVARWACAVLLMLSPLGSVVDGIFTLESSSFIHLVVGFLLGCLTPVVSFLVAGLFFRRVPGFRRFGTWLLLGSPLTLVLLILFFLTFNAVASGANHGVAGLTERLLIVEIQAWYVAMGVLAFRRSLEQQNERLTARKVAQ
jgi:phosphoglycerol transferase MdoB-like AlkP superfamily enzyme